jgi:hypothetical protein
VGVKLLATLTAAAALATPAGYVQGQQRDDGGFGDAQVSAWATLALVAAGAETGEAPDYLARQQPASVTDVALIAMARAAAGDRPDDLLLRLRAHRPGKLINATIWTILALRQAGEPAPRELVQALLQAQTTSGGWSWLRGGAPDSNDTAAAIQALRWSKVRGRPISRGLAFIRGLTAANGGVRLVAGREPDAQSTAWAIQAYVAAGVRPPGATFTFLASLRRTDGSYRYSRRYAVTPAIVTAQVLPALARRQYPLDGRR